MTWLRSGASPVDAMPVGVDHYRSAYILAVNSLAAQLGSSIRVRAFDRTGMHNSCLIWFVPEDLVFDVPPEQLTEGISSWPDGCKEAEPDELMQKAIAQAADLAVDSFVTCRVSLSRSARKALTRLKADDQL